MPPLAGDQMGTEMTIRFEVRPTVYDGFRWRLLSRNNRTVAIAPVDSGDRSECVERLQRMWATARTRKPQLVRENGGTWSWVLFDDGGSPVAQSAAVYPRRIDCANAVDRFLRITSALEDVPLDDVIAEPRRRTLRRARSGP
jgi:uncharacterized protein YegP (UPF0339 family)